MKFTWSPDWLLVAGAGFFAASLGVWWFSGYNLLGWMLITAALPLIFEASAWQQASLAASARYAVDEATIYNRAYELKDALPRFAVLYCWLFGLLVAREMKSLPENGWTWVILGGPVLIWAALTMRAYQRCIRSFVAANGVSERRGKRWKH